MNLFTSFTTGATRLLICIVTLLPTLSKAQWSLNISGSGEISHLNQLNAIIDYHNQLNASALIAPIPHFGLFTGRSLEIGRDWKHLQLGIHYNRLTQTVNNNGALASNAPVALSYYNAQLGFRGEWMFNSFFGMGGTFDCNLLNISRSNPAKQNGYYTNSTNLFAEGYWSYRYQLHFQKLLNHYFSVSFRPYYQQSLKSLDFSGVHRSLGKTTTLSAARDVPEFAAAPQRWITFGSELTLRMFLSGKGLN
jgi:hypothetical protein